MLKTWLKAKLKCKLSVNTLLIYLITIRIGGMCKSILITFYAPDDLLYCIFRIPIIFNVLLFLLLFQSSLTVCEKSNCSNSSRLNSRVWHDDYDVSFRPSRVVVVAARIGHSVTSRVSFPLFSPSSFRNYLGLHANFILFLHHF